MSQDEHNPEDISPENTAPEPSPEAKVKSFYWGQFYLGLLAALGYSIIFALISNGISNVAPEYFGSLSLLGFIIYLVGCIIFLVKAENAKRRSFWLGALLAIPTGMIIFAGVCVVVIAIFNAGSGLG